VQAKDSARNALIVVQGHDHPLLASSMLTTGPVHWLCHPRRTPFECSVKVRYRQSDQQAQLTPAAGGAVQVRFAQPQRAVAPGQYAVFYEGERCLGGAVIESVQSVCETSR
jgi:tRNA-specific 2-thiouridylase